MVVVRNENLKHMVAGTSNSKMVVKLIDGLMKYFYFNFFWKK